MFYVPQMLDNLNARVQYNGMKNTTDTTKYQVQYRARHAGRWMIHGTFATLSEAEAARRSVIHESRIVEVTR